MQETKTTYYHVATDGELKEYKPSTNQLKAYEEMDKEFRAKFGKPVRPEAKVKVEEVETEKPEQLELGMKVNHKILGPGKVVEIKNKTSYQGQERTYVRVKFDNRLGDDYRNYEQPELDNTAVFYDTSLTNPKFFTK